LTADPNTRLVAMSDGFEDRIDASLAALRGQAGLAERVDVPAARRFPGFDGYQQVIEHSDVVLLTTPPHFRPMQLQAAVDAGKHVFAEKPVAVDAPGVRRVLAACETARQKNLSVVCGLQTRYSNGHREIVQRLQHDALGPIRALQAIDFMAIMGRMATYTGQGVTWDQAMNSQEDLSPDRYAWDATPPVSEVATPGVTRWR